jgi:hypothetical protein
MQTGKHTACQHIDFSVFVRPLLPKYQSHFHPGSFVLGAKVALFIFGGVRSRKSFAIKLDPPLPLLLAKLSL